MKTLALILALIATPALSQTVCRNSPDCINMAGELRAGFFLCVQNGSIVKCHLLNGASRIFVLGSDGHSVAVKVKGDDNWYGVPVRAVYVDCPAGRVAIGSDAPFACPR